MQDVSARIAMGKKVCVRIRSTFDDLPGTLIGPCNNNEQKDLVGITVKDKEDGLSLITLVYKTGTGAVASDQVAKQLNVTLNPSDEPDVIAFDFPKSQIKDALLTIPAPYIKKT